MGVPTFFKWLSLKYPKVLKDAVEPQETEIDGEVIPIDPVNDETPNGEIDNLYLDMNGIIHPCCHPEDCDVPTDENEMFNAIFEYIDRLISIVKPRKLLYMAIDGVAPRAKMNQQRTRRFKAAAEADQEEELHEELRKQFEAEGREAPPAKTHWDSNVITPGTPFFARLTKALQYYINDRMSKCQLWRGFKVILSDASCPGEGEHKIMQYIRSQRTYPKYNPNQRHCLYGADADLIMLGLATHEPHFFILREAVQDAAEFKKCSLCGRSGHNSVDCNEEHRKLETEENKSQKTAWKPLQFLSISILREYLQNEFTFADSRNSNFVPDFERCVDDFVLMCFFVGNDFLPHLPSLSIHKGSIDQMLLLYQKIRPAMGDYLTDAGRLNLNCLKVFVNHLGKVEEIVFQEELKRQDRMRQRNKGNVPASNVPVVTEEQDENFAALRSLKESVDLSQSDPSDSALSVSSSELVCPPPAKRQKISREQNIDDFRAQMRDKTKAVREIENPEDHVQLGMGEKKDWHHRYYQKKFHLSEEDLTNLDSFSSRVANSYVEGLAWVLHYYYQGVCSWEWYYPFHYAPFASDIAEFGLSKEKQFSIGKPFKPFEQLMAVLPARSSHCLPAVLANLMKNPDSPIIDFYPKAFKEDPDGKRFKWQWVALLPFINQERLLDAIKPLETQLNKEELERNATGTDRLFVSQFHQLANQISDIQKKKGSQEQIDADLGDCLCGEFRHSNYGFLTGTIIEAGKETSKKSFPPLPASCVSCDFTCAPLITHVCRFIAGAIPPKQILTAGDLVEDPSRDRRFNAAAAKRIIIGSLGRLGVVSRETVEQHNWRPRNPTLNYNNSYDVISDNPYQAQMFGRSKRPRPNEWESEVQHQPSFQPSRQYNNQEYGQHYNTINSRPTQHYSHNYNTINERPNQQHYYQSGRPNYLPGRQHDYSYERQPPIPPSQPPLRSLQRNVEQPYITPANIQYSQNQTPHFINLPRVNPSRRPWAQPEDPYKK